MKNWQWKPGMLALLDGFRFVRLVRDAGDGDWHGVVYATGRYLRVPLTGNDVPELKDAATVGCAIALARELWSSPAAQVSPNIAHDGTVTNWVFMPNIPGQSTYANAVYGATEGAAVLAAIEAAPAREAP